MLSLVREVAERMAEEAGFDAETRAKIALAVDEATTNVIEHAYEGQPGREIEVGFEHRGDVLRVEITDTGRAVDKAAVPRYDLQRYAREKRRGGMGLHLMESIMDSVAFTRSGRRNVCTLVKRRPRTEAP